MKYQKKNLITVVLILLGALLIFAACENESISNPSEDINFNSSEYALFDFDDAMSTVEGGTIESEFNLAGPFPGENGFVRRGPNRPGRHLSAILWLLELNDEQKESIRSHVGESHTCVRAGFEQFRIAIEPIITNANEERRLIIEQYRNGEITNDEAYFALQQLREETHSAIENDPDVQAAKQAICDCKINLLDNIGSILTEDQLVIWNDWYSNLAGPCFG